jgi:hypothetical protein
MVAFIIVLIDDKKRVDDCHAGKSNRQRRSLAAREIAIL